MPYQIDYLFLRSGRSLCHEKNIDKWELLICGRGLVCILAVGINWNAWSVPRVYAVSWCEVESMATFSAWLIVLVKRGQEIVNSGEMLMGGHIWIEVSIDK